MNGRATTRNGIVTAPAWFAAGLVLRPLHLALCFPSILYLGTLAVFLFRPPDVNFYYLDRVAFCGVTFFVGLRALACREESPFVASISWPMLGLIGLAVVRASREPFDLQTWSLVASKFIVPFTLFHVAILVFRAVDAQAHFEIFVVIVLAYLIFTAVAFLVGARTLIFPSFILDESLGIHVDRARGPFLQAVANGVSLNILGLLAVVFSWSRGRVVLLLWLVLPLAVLATMTRAVWISFAFSVIALGFRIGERHLRRLCLAFVCVGLLISLLAGLTGDSMKNALVDRAEERGPVDVRLSVYVAGWAMIQERPITGWTAGGMYEELARRMEGYHVSAFYIHNTYLSLLIEFGIPGLLLYGILFFNLFRLGRASTNASDSPSVLALRKIWPILLCVYLFNAFFVDMAYQFVIGLLFTVAGILQASKESAA